MWMWRVVLPGLGLGLSAVILWQTWQVGQSRGAYADVKSADGARDSARKIASNRIVAEGRVVARPGADVVVGTEDGGTIERVLVNERSHVRKGDLLVEFRSTAQEAALAEAKAKLTETEAQHTYQHRQMNRTLKSDTTSKAYQAELDAAHRDLDTAIAQRRAAIAAVKRCEAALARTRLTAPIDGTIVAQFVQPGETVAAGARLVEIADLSQVRVEAEVDEFDIGRLLLGAEAAISAEGADDKAWRGRVEEIPDRVVERETRPDDPGRPSDSRVLRVKVALDERVPFKLGQKVDLEIQTQAPAAATARASKSQRAR
jgi:RND family efflux transporter MFP subunit